MGAESGQKGVSAALATPAQDETEQYGGDSESEGGRFRGHGDQDSMELAAGIDVIADDLIAVDPEELGVGCA
jgi:hypothetical protein